ncbi:hypothetical protein RUND412_000398 [Rhizina undulata]
MSTFKERVAISPFFGKAVQEGDFFWGEGVSLHTTALMREHLGSGKTDNKNRKRRCFYVLQIIGKDLVLACTTTTRNSLTWDDMPEKYHRYFLPVGQAPAVLGRRPISVHNDWERAFELGKSLLFLEDIEVVPKAKLSAYICSAFPDEIERIKHESRSFMGQIWWGKYLSATMPSGWRKWDRGQFIWEESQEFLQLETDSKGLIIIPEINAAKIRHSSRLASLCEERVSSLHKTDESYYNYRASAPALTPPYPYTNNNFRSTPPSSPFSDSPYTTPSSPTRWDRDRYRPARRMSSYRPRYDRYRPY